MNEISKFTQDNFKAWLEAQSSKRKFNYLDNEGCLFASFLREACGVAILFCGAGWFKANKQTILFPGWAVKLDSKVAGLDNYLRFSVADVKKIVDF